MDADYSEAITIHSPRIKGRARGSEIWIKRGSQNGGVNNGKNSSKYRAKHYLGALFSELHASWKARRRA